MDKGCNCNSYECGCYKPSNIPQYKEEELLNLLWNIEASWDTDSISTKKYAFQCLDQAIGILILRGIKCQTSD